MNNFLFFSYAKLKGYTFELIVDSNKQPDARSYFSSRSASEHTIFANYAGRMVGAVQLKSTILPEAIYKEMGFKKGGDKIDRSLLISMFFINSESNLRADIIMTGLLLTLQQYAHKTGNRFCVGYSYESFSHELSNSQMPLFELNYEQLIPCPADVEIVIKNNMDVQLEKLFVWNTRNDLITFNLFKKSNKVRQIKTAEVFLSKAA